MVGIILSVVAAIMVLGLKAVVDQEVWSTMWAQSSWGANERLEVSASASEEVYIKRGMLDRLGREE